MYIFFFLFFCIISRYLNVEHFLKYYDDFIFSWMFFYGLLTKEYKKDVALQHVFHIRLYKVTSSVCKGRGF